MRRVGHWHARRADQELLPYRIARTCGGGRPARPTPSPIGRHQQTPIGSHRSVAHSTFFLNEHPSVSRALPPVGWQSTVEQLPQSTTVCAWLNTVVLRAFATRRGVRAGSMADAERQRGRPGGREYLQWKGRDPTPAAGRVHAALAGRGFQSRGRAYAHMLKHPGHFTSMKNEFGVCTRRLSLWRRCSSSRGGCRRSTSPIEICACDAYAQW